MASSAEVISGDLSDLTKDDIIDRCRRNGPMSNGFLYPSSENPSAYTKYGPSVAMGEARTQDYAFKQTKKKDGITIRIPEVYHTCEFDGEACIIMEYIKGKPVSSGQQVADAVAQLLSILPPEGSCPGPVGGGIVKHPFFKEAVACEVYKSVRDLQDHINNVLLTNLACFYVLINIPILA
jgi:hypothetical protein